MCYRYQNYHIHLLDVVFCFVSPHVPFSGDNNEILGPPLRMHSECFEYDFFRWLRLVMMMVPFLQIVVSNEPDQIIFLFVFNEHAIRWWIAGMIITKAMCTWRGSPGLSFSNRRGSPLRDGWSWHRSGPWSSLSQIGHGRSNCPRWYSWRSLTCLVYWELRRKRSPLNWKMEVPLCQV